MAKHRDASFGNKRRRREVLSLNLHQRHALQEAARDHWENQTRRQACSRDEGYLEENQEGENEWEWERKREREMREDEKGERNVDEEWEYVFVDAPDVLLRK